MALPTTKIYELKTLGYDKLISELQNVERGFQNLKTAKQQLEIQKLSTQDEAVLKRVTSALKDYEIEIRKTRLEKQQLESQIRTILSVRQTEIVAAKLAADAIKAEAGSITDLTKRLQILNQLRRSLSPTSGSTVQFEGQALNFAQAQAQAKAMNEQIKTLSGNMKQLETVGVQTTSGLATAFNKITGQIGQMLLHYVGLFAAFNAARGAIQENIELSDSFADLQIRIKGTKKDVEELFESLKKIDTRTSLQGLVEIANVIAKKGVPKQDIAALTQEFDKLNVVLGKELGEPGTATASIIKLITIFNDDKHVTAQRVQEIGTALFKLTTTGVATGEFLVNFAERVGAVRGITGLTLPNILGMGAALQQLGQRVELSGTAIVQLTTKMFSNVPKFAEAAGRTAEEFRKILDASPMEALVAVAENLRKAEVSLEDAKFEEVVAAFGEVGVTGARIKAVLGDIATNADFVRARMREATVSTADYARQTAAAELKQHTFAAVLERVKKAFETLAVSKPVQVTLAGIAAIVLTLVNALPILITAVTFLTITWAIQNAQLILLRLQLLYYNLALGANYLAVFALNILYVTQQILLFSLTTAYRLVTAAANLFNIALGAGPIKILLTLLGLGITLMQAFGRGIGGASQSLEQQNRILRLNADLHKEALKATSEQRAEAQLLVGVVKDLTISEGTRLAMLQKLIEISPIFKQALVDDKINYQKLNIALEQYNDNLVRSAELEAAKARQAREIQRLTDLSIKQQDIEFAISTRNFKQLDDETSKNIFARAFQDQSFLEKALKVVPGESDMLRAARNVVKDIQAGMKETTKAVDDAQIVFNAKLAELDAIKAKQLESEKPKIAEAVEVNVAQLQKDVDNLNAKIKVFKGAQVELDKLIKSRDDIQAKLDAALDKKKKTAGFRGSRLTGDERDDFSTIDAETKLQLSLQEKLFAELQKTHQATADEELDYITKIEHISIQGLNKKIARLNAEKDLNAKEKVTLATFQEEKTKLELKFIQDRQAIFDKDFNDRRNILKEQLEQQIADARLKAREIDEDPQVSAIDKAQANLVADTQILALQQEFNVKIDALEKQLLQRSRVNSKERAAAILKTESDLIKDRIALGNARLKDIDIAGNKERAQFSINYQKLRQAIIENDKLTETQRERALDKLDKLHKFTILSSEEATLRIQFEEIKKLYAEGLKNEEDFLKAKEALEKKTTDKIEAGKDLKKANVNLPSGSNTQQQLLEQLQKAFGFGEGSAQSKLLGNVIAQSFDLATNAMHTYFDSEQQRIKDSLKTNLERLDLEKEQVKARAGSQAEIDAIEKQYAIKRRKAEQESLEALKKSRRAEAKISLASELGNLAVAAASAGAFAGPGAPVLIPLLYAIMSGLAFARYALNVANINREKLAYGGNVPTRGGRFGGKPHSQGGTPFVFKGEEYEGEVDELAIIRTRNARTDKVHTIRGTHEQIASMLNELGGGKRFKPGARLSRFETGGILGSNFQAPVFRGTSNNETLDPETLFNEIRNLANEQSKRIDRIEVLQVTDSVTKAQKKMAKQSEIGIL